MAQPACVPSSRNCLARETWRRYKSGVCPPAGPSGVFMVERKMRLGAFVMATGHHIAAWRDPGADANAGHSLSHYQEVARTAERGKFDMLFLADSVGVWERGNEDAVSRLGRLAHFEPVTLFSALAASTQH